jgi:hypothetical protein
LDTTLCGIMRWTRQTINRAEYLRSRQGKPYDTGRRRKAPPALGREHPRCSLKRAMTELHCMTTYTVQLFSKATDEKAAEEWAVIADTPEEARQLLRKRFGGKWRLWGTTKVAIAKDQISGPTGVMARMPKE